MRLITFNLLLISSASRLLILLRLISGWGKVLGIARISASVVFWGGHLSRWYGSLYTQSILAHLSAVDLETCFELLRVDEKTGDVDHV